MKRVKCVMSSDEVYYNECPVELFRGSVVSVFPCSRGAQYR